MNYYLISMLSRAIHQECQVVTLATSYVHTMKCVVVGSVGRVPHPAGGGRRRARGARSVPYEARPRTRACRATTRWRNVVKCTRAYDTELTHPSCSCRRARPALTGPPACTMGCARGLCTAEKIFIFINIAFAVSILSTLKTITDWNT